MQFFSNAQYANPMVVRIAGLAYQKGFGGHFHNDNSVGSLREIPGLIMACPSNGEDAVGMLRSVTAAAKVNGRVSAFIEPIALYMTKDLHEEKDGLWSIAKRTENRQKEFGGVMTEEERGFPVIRFRSSAAPNRVFLNCRMVESITTPGPIRGPEINW